MWLFELRKAADPETSQSSLMLKKFGVHAYRQTDFSRFFASLQKGRGSHTYQLHQLKDHRVEDWSNKVKPTKRIKLMKSVRRTTAERVKLRS